MITLPRSTELSSARTAIAARLEEEYETHTERLATLTAAAGGSRGHRVRANREAARAADVASARRALADVAQALRRFAEGTYGLCERCLHDIPLNDLERSPAARWCPSCVVSAAF